MDTIKKIKRSIYRNKLVIKIGLYLQKFGIGFGISALYKVEKIKSAQKFFNLITFVETGTYFGTTLGAVQDEFITLYSIELTEILAKEAQSHFSKYKNIQVIQGDSGLYLEKIVTSDTTKKLFWLDAHYSGGITAISKNFGETPISNEIITILKNWVKGSVILIDDAPLFNGTNNYPKYNELVSFIEEQKLGLNVFVDENIIHIY